MPPSRTSKKWPSQTYAHGYVESRSGRAELRFKGRRRASGLLFVTKNRSEALKRLDEWIYAIENPVEVIEVAEGLSLSQAVALFRQENLPSFTPAVKNNYLRAFNTYCLTDISLQDPDAVRAMIAAQNKEVGLGRNTQEKYLSYLALFFDELVESGHISRNPITKKMIPSRFLPMEILIFTLDEVDRVCQELRKAPDGEEYALAVQWLRVTGMRIGEMVKLHYSDVTNFQIQVYGKGRRARTIPVSLLPGLSDLIEQIENLPETPGVRYHGARRKTLGSLTLPGERRFFRWTNDTIIRTRFNEACAAAEVDRFGGARTLHNLRGTAGWWMETELGLEERVMCDILGHEPRTRRQHYRISPSVADLVARSALHVERKRVEAGSRENGQSMANE